MTLSPLACGDPTGEWMGDWGAERIAEEKLTELERRRRATGGGEGVTEGSIFEVLVVVGIDVLI